MPNWKNIITLAVTILTFIFAGVWWALAVFLVGSIIVGWEDRYTGPFPTNRPDEKDDYGK